MARMAESLLDEPHSSRIAGAAERLDRTSVRAIEESLPGALAGDPEKVRTYMSAYCSLTSNVLSAVSKQRPGSATPPWLEASLASEAMSAPFSPWVGSLGAGRGTAVALVESIRRALPRPKPVIAPAKRQRHEWSIDSADVVRFYRAVAEYLEQREHPLKWVKRVLDLNRTELAALFGVTRQAIERWERQAVPAERQERLASLAAICDLLSSNLKPERVPGVARRPADAYGGRSALETIAAGNADLVLDELRDAFDWASTT